MRFENRTPSEGINTDETSHPLKEFFVLTGLIAFGAALLVIALSLIAQVVAKYVPFRFEQQLAARFEASANLPHSFAKEDEALQVIVAKLLPNLDLPTAMTIKVHYLDGDTVNAFATLGGHIFVYRGLLAQMPSENALAFVLAHEIAHIKHRHPAQALGRGVAIGIALTALSASAGATVADRPLGAAGLLTVLKFSRDHETEADATALQALANTYGNVSGGVELFAMFEKINRQWKDAPQFLLTHPLSNARRDTLLQTAKARSWLLEGAQIALPIALRKSVATTDNQR